MSGRSRDGDYKYPTLNLGDIRTEHQVPPHDRPTGIKRRSEPRFITGDGPAQPYAARPPEWTEQASCHGLWDFFDETSPSDDTLSGWSTSYATSICEACPVRVECLEAALEEEVDARTGLPVGSSYRYGIRGGLRPYARAKLAKERLNVDIISDGEEVA